MKSLNKNLKGQNQKKSLRKFKTGSIRDSEEGKEDYIETIPWIALKRYAQYMTACKKKYGQGNFKKGIPIDAYERSEMRHTQKYLANKYEGANEEPEVDHLCAKIFNIFGIIYEEEKAKQKVKNKLRDGN